MPAGYFLPFATQFDNPFVFDDYAPFIPSFDHGYLEYLGKFSTKEPTYTMFIRKLSTVLQVILFFPRSIPNTFSAKSYLDPRLL